MKNGTLHLQNLKHEKDGKGKSMPSGDACATVVCSGIFWKVFEFLWFMFLCVPMASLGRVYVFCY